MLINLEKLFLIKNLIASGTFGSIYIVKNLETDKLFVFKISISLEKNDKIKKEKEILCRLNNNYIIKYFGSFINTNGLYTIILEYMPSDLRSIIENIFILNNKKLRLEEKKKILFQILKGIEYIHSNFTTHNDLKPENILIDSNFNIKICDFGMATNTNKDINFNQLFTNLKYESPERLLGTKNPEDLYSSDIWSFGCITIELLTGKTIFNGINKIDQIFNIFKIVGTPINEDLNYLNSLPSVSETGILLPSFLPNWDDLNLGNKEDKCFLELIKCSLNPSSRKRIDAKKALELELFSDLQN